MSPRTEVIAAAFLATMAMPAMAQDVLLTVTAGGNTHHYDLEALQELPVTEFTTSTNWTEGEVTFTGVALATLLAEAGVEDGSVMATAINDYAVEIPVAEVTEDAPIIAYMQDGEILSPRDKGPLWVVYPFDSDPEYQTEIAYSRSIWQLDRITGAE
ncbi:molybdopterin-dependent oxidoreductase [Paracoccus sp. PARArs4]|uniref:molybdopterin-dependent oxidoreductase n=1 Tax=Paracoccus sp. PARArs4 TaxID=2853442 RepID=UPI0024A70CA7|nr:molybdopterin-dependent oxidoreductase [Paracoccus sp. PARArs4]